MPRTPDMPGTLPELGEDELLSVEYDLPRVDYEHQEHTELERERYDEQILAALVAPSF